MGNAHDATMLIANFLNIKLIKQRLIFVVTWARVTRSLLDDESLSALKKSHLKFICIVAHCPICAIIVKNSPQKKENTPNNI